MIKTLVLPHMEQSLTEENYLKAIFFLSKTQEKGVSTKSIGESLDIKPPTVSDMLKKLSEKKLIKYAPYKGVLLTKTGEKIALKIIRKHRLWETFLVEHFRFKWDEVHDIAEQLEHIESKELPNRLEKFLDFPKTDPHGDPIPDRDGVFPIELSQTLADCSINQNITIIGVKDHTSEFLNYLDSLHIELGTQIEIKKINDFDKSQEILVNQGQLKNISNDVAENLFVKIK
jgi:DtxR family Mn-dependent transcriptional regulator